MDNNPPIDDQPTLDRAALNNLKHVMDNGIGVARPDGFPNRNIGGRAMKRAKALVREITYAANHENERQRMFTDDRINELVAENALAVKMIAFVKSQGILNLFNDEASTHPMRVAAFHGVRAIAYRAMGVEEFDYVAITPDGLVAMGTRIGTCCHAHALSRSEAQTTRSDGSAHHTRR